MSSSIPLIRAAAVVPAEMWLLANGRSAADLMAEAGLPPFPATAPTRLVSLHAFFTFLVRMAETEGPDFGARIATPEALLHLGVPARAVRASRTVREALQKVSSTFHQHASHVFFRVTEKSGGIEVAESIPVSGTVHMHHQAQQHIARFVSALGLLANGRPLNAKVRIAPHPELGVEHLKAYLGKDVVAGPNKQLRMWIPDASLDIALPWEPQEYASPAADVLMAAARPSLSESARILIAGMVDDGNPGMDRLALCAGRSRRTLQRFLAAEGTSFAELLDSVRQDHALSHLSQSRESVSSIAENVGFHSTSSLSRAVRRWTNASPRQLRRNCRGA